MGSAAYAAPEILANEHYVGPATDVWSLGVIMYTLLTGKQPFDQSGNQATFFQKVQLAEFEMPEFVSVGTESFVRCFLELWGSVNGMQKTAMRREAFSKCRTAIILKLHFSSSRGSRYDSQHTEAESS